MPPSLRLTVDSPQCVTDDFGGEIVALNLETGSYFSLRDLGAAIWRDLASGHGVADVVAALGGPDQPLGGEALGFVKRLVSSGLLRRANGGEAPAEPPTVLALVAGGTTGIVMDEYDEMRDLILADPIHDVDEEIGWPVRRAGT